MVSCIDYAALSALVYNDIKSVNKLTTPVIEGWSELPIYPVVTSTFTGFNARAYSNGTDIYSGPQILDSSLSCAQP